MSYTPQPNSENPVTQGSPIPQSSQFSPVNPQMSASPMPPAVPPQKRKTGLIVTIVIVAVLVVTLVGLFIANAVVGRAQENWLKEQFSKEGFSNVKAEIDSSPMLVSYFKDYYRHATITASEGKLTEDKSAKKDAPDLRRVKDIKIDVYGFKGGDNPVIEKGTASYAIPGEDFDKGMLKEAKDAGMTVNRQGNKITVAGEEEGLKFQVIMTLHFKPGKSGESAKISQTVDKITINGSEEFMGQKLTPAELGIEGDEETPIDFAKGTTLKNIDFSGKDIKYDFEFKNVKLKDIGKYRVGR